jgi:hypothetical protein
VIRTTHYKRRLWAGISRVYVDSCRSWLSPVATPCQASTFVLVTTKKSTTLKSCARMQSLSGYAMSSAAGALQFTSLLELDSMRRRRSARKRKIVLDAALGLVAGAALTSHPILFPVRVKAKPSLRMQ